MDISAQQTSTYRPKVDRRRSVRNSWQHYFQRWIIKRIPPSRNVFLNHHNIFILPNKQGLGFSVILVLMLIGAINYEIRLALALVFLLIGMFIISIFYTYRNLSGLEVSASAGSSVFAGDKAEVNVTLIRHFKRLHEEVLLSFKSSGQTTANLINVKEQRFSLFLPTTQRGRFAPGRLTIKTTFPFGICWSWSFLNLNFDCLVYPKPVACENDLLNSSQEANGLANIISGNEDFYGLREYQHGDSLQHVAWKNLARGQGMFTKQFVNQVDDGLWLDWEMFDGFSVEERLSRLCYCVLKLDALGLEYGLKLPGVEVELMQGASHYNRVMEALALYPPGSDAGVEP